MTGMTGMAIHPLALNPWAGIVAELTALVALMVGLRLYQRWRALAPETSRKLFHLGGGLTTLTFPWVFTAAWPVLLLALVTIPSLLALKYVAVLRGSLGSVLYGVRRTSFGEVYFPLSVCLLFLLAHDDLLLYAVPLLILTFADTAAAVVGKRYGSLLYRTPGGHKSVEGSMAFFVVACLCVLLPLLLMTSVDRAVILGIALLLALLVMLVEAVSWAGLDNLLIPLASFVFLHSLLAGDLDTLLFQVVMVGVLLGVAALWRGQPAPRGEHLHV